MQTSQATVRAEGQSSSRFDSVGRSSFGFCGAVLASAVFVWRSVGLSLSEGAKAFLLFSKAASLDLTESNSDVSTTYCDRDGSRSLISDSLFAMRSGVGGCDA